MAHKPAVCSILPPPTGSVKIWPKCFKLKNVLAQNYPNNIARVEAFSDILDHEVQGTSCHEYIDTRYGGNTIWWQYIAGSSEDWAQGRGLIAQ